MSEPFEGFEIGKKYDLHGEMWPASPGFGSYFTGIAPKGRFPRTEAVVVLARLGERTRYGDAPRYGNRLDGDVLVFSGEDRKSRPDAKRIDQSPTSGFNRVLTESAERGIPIYCFCSREADDRWEYLGLGEVGSWSFEPRSGRRVVEYRIAMLGVPSKAGAEELRAQAERDVLSSELPTLRSPSARPTASGLRKARSSAFSQAVKMVYSNRCAICGVERRDADGNPEVEAAHIFPVEEDGADDVRNGMALCRLHHWAFDGGLIGIEDDLLIRVVPIGLECPGVREYDHRALAILPAAPARPHPLFLSARRELDRRRFRQV